jgi:lipid-A-disaccharide synthase
MEDWRNFLYPLGFLANIFFAARFILQWIKSEKVHQSHFSDSFWTISLWGSLLMTLHSFIQIQYPVCLIQACNAILYGRNLQLIRHQKNELMPFSKVCLCLAILVAGLTAAFMAQSWLVFGQLEWMRVPDFIEPKGMHVSFMWNAIGFCGTFLFASRFWIHWWRAEKDFTKALKSDFWIISLVGSVLALAYFIHIKDLVNIIGFGAGMVPYMRNLILMKKAQKSY